MMSIFKNNVLRGTLLFLAMILGVIMYWKTEDNRFRNLRVVDTGELYRCGQLDTDELTRISNEYGIKTIVTFRDVRHPGDPIPDQHEVDFAAEHGIRHVRISPRRWSDPEGGPPPIQAQIDRFLNEMDSARDVGPILIHCFAGIHRTGAYSAIYRMEYDGWSNDDAIREMQNCGYTTLEDDPDILHFLENYVPRVRTGNAAENK